MRVVVDTSMLLLFLRPSTPAPRDRDGKPVPEHAGERVKYLIANLEASNATVVVPTPVLRDEAETWAKLKFDRQIVAIAKVCGATSIYSHDGGIQTVAGRVGIEVLRLHDLPLPPEMLQMDLLESP